MLQMNFLKCLFVWYGTFWKILDKVIEIKNLKGLHVYYELV